MKTLPVILFCLLFTGAAFSSPVKLKEKSAEVIFLRKVEIAVRAHDADQFLQYVEPVYKRTQHDEFLQGNTIQFLQEFFCSLVPFNEIREARLVDYSLMQGSKTEYSVIFFIAGRDKETECTFFMSKNLSSGTFSIYSAVG